MVRPGSTRTGQLSRPVTVIRAVASWAGRASSKRPSGGSRFVIQHAQRAIGYDRTGILRGVG